jgi:hypothetical protein
MRWRGATHRAGNGRWHPKTNRTELATFRHLIGVLGQNTGPSRAIWANPVQITFTTNRAERRAPAHRLADAAARPHGEDRQLGVRPLDQRPQDFFARGKSRRVPETITPGQPGAAAAESYGIVRPRGALGPLS